MLDFFPVLLTVLSVLQLKKWRDVFSHILFSQSEPVHFLNKIKKKDRTNLRCLTCARVWDSYALSSEC